MRFSPVVLLSLVLTFPVSAATPYHLELEATPAAAFPYLKKFGTVDLHVYPSGVRAEALWLNGFSRNGARSVTVANPLGRMYVEMPIAEIAPTIAKLAGQADAVERSAVPTIASATKGKVAGVPATRHRLRYGSAWIDYWTTAVVPENPHLRAIVYQFVAGISPATADVVRSISGTPVYVELNFRRFKKVPLLKLTKLSMTAEGEKSALELGPLYVRAAMFEKLLK